jgi:hypothetical protein
LVYRAEAEPARPAECVSRLIIPRGGETEVQHRFCEGSALAVEIRDRRVERAGPVPLSNEAAKRYLVLPAVIPQVAPAEGQEEEHGEEPERLHHSNVRVSETERHGNLHV